MKLIRPASFDLANYTSGEDIFSYYRQVYHTDNPHEKGVISIIASSTLSNITAQRDDVSVLISTPNGKRWVSEAETNPSITIDFKSNRVDLIGYRFTTHLGFRYISAWDLFGIEGSQTILLDSRRDSPLCSPFENKTCKEPNQNIFRAQRPGSFHVFKFVHRGLDSNGDKFFSLTSIEFYGAVNSFLNIRSCRATKYIRLFETLYTLVYSLS